MASASRRTVITGIGVINPLGATAPAFYESLRAGKNGVRLIQAFDASNLPTRFAGVIQDFVAKDYIETKQRKNLRVMARGIQLAVSAAQIAMNDSKIDKAKLDPTRFAIAFGSGLLATELEELGPASQVSRDALESYAIDLDKWADVGMANITPLWMLKYLPNMLACHVSIMHNAQGPNNTITESDAASLLALGEATRLLTRDMADFCLVGGADSKVNPLSMVRQCMFAPLSRRNDAPEKASRPFDLNRDGLVIGEGASVLAVEELEHARRRGARIYGEIVGFGAAFDAKKNGDGLARAMQAALREANLGPESIDHVNAHGLSTVEGDANEARAIRTVFGSFEPQVLAVKSSIGNLGAGAGTTELAASLLSMHHGQLPATLNYETPDPDCAVQVNRTLRAIAKPYFMKVNYTDMGQCGAVVCKKWAE